VKESLFNIIAGCIDSADVLDLFAGTGNLGIEALSRGAATAVFIDKNPECVSVIKENLNHTKLSDRAEVYTADINDAIFRLAKRNRKFDIIFMDPPYGKNFIDETLKNILKNDIINRNGIIVAEHDFKDNVPPEIGKLVLYMSRRYGDTVLSFYSVSGETKN